MSPAAGPGSSGPSSVFYGVFIASDIDGAGDKGWRRYHIGQPTYTLGGLSEHVSEICLFHQCSFFMVKSKTFDLGTNLLRWWIFRLTDVGLKEFCCKFFSFRNIWTLPQEIYLSLLEINIFKKLNNCKALCTKDHPPFPVEGVNRLSPFLHTSTFLQYLSHRLPHVFLNALRSSSDGQKAQLHSCTKCH